MFKYLLLLLIPTLAWADLTIFDVRKNLPMSDSDPVYRDFIINGGSEAGLSVGMVLTVQRRIPLYDNYQNRSAGDLQVKVAKIKVIHVQKGLAVARLHSEFTREATPLLDEPYIMVGDQVDLGSATTDKGDKKAEAPAPAPQPVAKEKEEPKSTKAEIVVNSVELSSEAPKAPPQLPPTQQKVDVPILQ